MKPKLFGLLVGISDYQSPVQPLPACVNDVEAVKGYLSEEKVNFTLCLEVLTNKQATKDQIVTAFRQHFQAARPNDVVLFYFSGHGVQEKVPQGWWPEEKNGLLECLACYDSIEPGSNNFYNFLADKELRWMIHELWAKNGGPHILTIFDCCHSGDNTRNLHLGECLEDLTEKTLLVNGTPKIFPARSPYDFIFRGKINQKRHSKEPLKDVIPEGRHVQLAACHSNESAYSRKTYSLFTKYLLEVLRRSHRRVSYHDLRSRIRNYIKNRYDQRPKIYIPEIATGDGYLIFLGKQGDGKPLEGQMYYSRKGKQWRMDLGALHGVSKMGEKVTVGVSADRNVIAKMGTVQPEYTTLSFELPDLELLLKNKKYPCVPADFFSNPIKVVLFDEANCKDIKFKMSGYLSNIKNLYVTPNEFEADYALTIKRMEETDELPMLYITPTGLDRHYLVNGENELQALVFPVQADAAGLMTATNYLRHISQWEYIKNLHHPGTVLFKEFPLRLELYQGEGTEIKPVPMINEVWETHSIQKAGNQVKFHIINQFNAPLYISLLYLSRRFDVDPNFLDPPLKKLEAGEILVVDHFDEEPIVLDIEDEVIQYQLPYDQSWLLFLVSTHKDNINVPDLTMSGLPEPFQTRGRGESRDVLRSRPEKNIEMRDWATRLVELRVVK